MEKDIYLITLSSDYIRGVQCLPDNIFITDDGKYEYEDVEGYWTDFNDYEAELVLGTVKTCCRDDALIEGQRLFGFSATKLIAYKLSN